MAAHARMKALSVFVGVWNTEGEIVATAEAPATTLRATDTYGFLPGGHFLLHTVDARMGDQVSRSIEIYGYDPARKSLVSRSYDDQGVSETFVAALTGGAWRIKGETLRFAGAFNKDATRLSGRWEARAAGRWSKLMDIWLTKAG